MPLPVMRDISAAYAYVFASRPLASLPVAFLTMQICISLELSWQHVINGDSKKSDASQSDDIATWMTFP